MNLACTSEGKINSKVKLAVKTENFCWLSQPLLLRKQGFQQVVFWSVISFSLQQNYSGNENSQTHSILINTKVVYRGTMEHRQSERSDWLWNIVPLYIPTMLGPKRSKNLQIWCTNVKDISSNLNLSKQGN